MTELVLRQVLVRALRADHRADHAVLSSQHAAIECPLQQRAVESQHRGGQAHLPWILEIDRVDRLVSQLPDRLGYLGQRRDADQEHSRVIRGQGAHDVAVASSSIGAVHRETAFGLIDPGDALSGQHLPAVRLDVIGCRLGKQARQVGPRQKKIACRPVGVETVAQDVEEYLRRGRLGRGVERGDAQRPPQQPRQVRALRLALQQYGDGGVMRQDITLPPHAQHEARRGQALQDGRAARGEQPCEQVQRGRQAGGRQRETLVNLPGEGETQQQQFGIGADLAHQAKRLAIGADQDVQAVVERGVAVLDPACPPAEGFCRFEYRDRHPPFGERDGRRHAGVATADHGHVHAGGAAKGAKPRLQRVARRACCPPRPPRARRPGLRRCDARCGSGRRGV